MSNSKNKLTAQVGFQVSSEQSTLDAMTKQFKKINTASKSVATNLSSIETALKQITSVSDATAKKMLANLTMTNAERKEIAKQDTIRISSAENQKLQAQKTADKLRLESFKTAERAKVAYAKQTTADITKQTQAIQKSYQNAMNQVASSINKIKATGNTQLRQSSSQFTAGLTNSLLQLSGARAVMNEIGMLSSEVVQVEKNAINIQRIMGDTSETLRNTLTSMATDVATYTATAVTDVQNIQSAWVRINEAFEDSSLLNQITKKTAEFVNVGEIENAEEAVTLLNASMLQFEMYTTDALGNVKVNMDEVSDTLDKWSYMADKTSLGTADEFGESLSKIGGYITALGGNIDDAIVMTSILGDRLAKTGSEAGNSLKTILAYANRDKTLKLFSDLGLETDEFNNSLSKTETEYQEFTVIMENLSDAYTQALAEGNEKVAKSIQNALGATRQGDAAIALLRNWSEDSKKYAAMIQESTDTNYLDEQNKALTQSFAAQWQNLQTSMVSAGTAIANSGLFEDLIGIMKGIGDLSTTISKANPVILDFASNMAELFMFKQAIKGLSKFIGVYDVFIMTAKQGSNAQKEAAIASAEQTAADIAANQAKAEQSILQEKTMIQYKVMRKGKKANIAAEQQEILKSKELIANETLKAESLARLTLSYNEGRLSVDQYTAALQRLNAVQTTNVATTQVSAEIRSIENANMKVGIFTTLMTKLKGGLTGVVTVAKTLFKTLLSPWTILLIALPFVITLISNFKSAAEKTAEKISDLKNEIKELENSISSVNDELATTKDRLAELRNKYKNGTITLVEKEEMEQLERTLNKLNEQYEREQAELDKKNNELAKQYTKSFTQDTVSRNRNVVEGKRRRRGGTITYESSTESYDTTRIQGILDKYEEYELHLQNIKKLRKQIENGDKSDTTKDLLDVEYENLEKTEAAIGKFDIDSATQYLEILQTTSLTWKELGFESKNAMSQTVSDLENITTEFYNFNTTTSGKLKKIFDSSRYRSSGARKELIRMAQDGTLDEETLRSYKELDDLLISGETDVQTLINSIVELGYVTGEIDWETFAGVDISSFVDDSKELQANLQNIDSDIAKVTGGITGTGGKTPNVAGDITSEDLLAMAEQYEGFYEVINASSEEQVEWLRKYKEQMLETFDSEYEEKHNALLEERTELLEHLNDLENSGDSGEAYTADLMATKEALEDVENKIIEVENMAQFAITIDVSQAMSQLNSLADGVSDLTDAMESLQAGTILSKAQLLDLCAVYPELIKQAGLFNSSTVDGQKAAINAVLLMKEQEYDATIDAKIAEFQAEKQAVDDKIVLANEQKDKLLQLAHLTTETSVEYQEEFMSEFNDYLATKFENKSIEEQEEVDITYDGFVSQAEIQEGYSVKSINVVKKFLSNIAEKYKSMENPLKSVAESVTSAVGGVFKKISSKLGAVSSSSMGEGNNFHVTLDAKGNYSINGEKAKGWIQSQLKDYDAVIAELQTESQGYTNAISNLEALKGLDLTAINGSADDAAEDAAKAAEKAASAAEDAAKEMEDIANKIEDFFEEYQKNIEDLQKKIADALKEKLQTEYDELVKAITNTYETQIDSLESQVKEWEKQIDELKGDTVEKKQENIGKLQSQLALWMQDDSPVGKKKQKELVDEITKLETEIKVDEIQAQIDSAEDTITTLKEELSDKLDKDSDKLDSRLKQILDSMTDGELYTKANNMIHDAVNNGSVSEIVTLLETYDPDYSGLAFLLGESTLTVMTRSVETALSGFLDILNGTITSTGGVSSFVNHSQDKVAQALAKSQANNGGTVTAIKTPTTPTTPTTNTPSSSSDNNSRIKAYHSVQKGDTLWDLAVKYYGSGSKYTKIQEENGISNVRALKIGSTLAIPFKVGGYTGDDEGLAYLHQRERVLTAEQTADFHKLIYDFMPKVTDSQYNATKANNEYTDNSTVFNKEIMSVNIDKVINNTPYDIKNEEDNLDRMLRKSLKSCGLQPKI